MCDMRMPVVLKAIAKQTAPNISLWHVVVTGHPSFVEEENVVDNFLMTGQIC